MPFSLLTTKIGKITVAMAATLMIASCADAPLDEPKELQDITQRFELDSKWKQVIGDGDKGKYNSLVPAVWEDKIVTSDINGLITAFDKSTGKVVWEKELEQPVSGGITINAGLIALGTKNAEVFVLDVNDGSQLWKADVSSEVLSKPAIDDNKVVVRTADGRIFALDLQSGKQEWFYDRIIPNLTLRGTSAPIAIGGIVVSGFANGKIATFNLESGDLLWEQRISVPKGSSEIARVVDVDASPIIYGDNLYAAGFNGFAIALDLRNGRYLWREEASVTREAMVDNKHVYLVNTESKIIALDRETGKEVWSQEGLMFRGATGAADNGNTIIVGDFEGYLHWLDKASGEIVAREQIDSYGIANAPLVTEELIYATSRHGYMHAIENPQFSSTKE